MTDEIRWREQHQQLEAQGYLWYRDHFRWGTTPAYRKPDGSSFRFIWFSEGGFEILKPSELLARLKKSGGQQLAPTRIMQPRAQ